MGTPDPEQRLASLRSRPWDSAGFEIPGDVAEVPAMLFGAERRMLYYLAAQEFTGEGVIADMGTYLGGSTMCFAAGLRSRSFKGPLIYTYDLFVLAPGAALREFPGEPPADMRTRGVFEENLRDYLDLVVVHEGDVLAESWDGPQIEILFIDIAKSHLVMDHLLSNFFPALVPGRSVVVVQDYLWGRTGPWHHIVMERLGDYLEYAVDTGAGSALFLLTREIPRSVLDDCRYMAIPMAEKLQLMDRAIARLDSPAKMRYLQQNQELLLSGEDESWGLHYHEM